MISTGVNGQVKRSETQGLFQIWMRQISKVKPAIISSQCAFSSLVRLASFKVEPVHPPRMLRSGSGILETTVAARYRVSSRSSGCCRNHHVVVRCSRLLRYIIHKPRSRFGPFDSLRTPAGIGLRTRRHCVLHRIDRTSISLARPIHPRISSTSLMRLSRRLKKVVEVPPS
jgi:hypothetical protein